MFDTVARHRRREISRRHRASRPSLEGMEARLLLYATLGGQWTSTARITYSLVPDGTALGGDSSDLFATMGARFGSAWQRQIQRAAAVWEAYAQIDLALVPDDGTPLGAAGAQQGDARFGDIRIGGTSLSAGLLAVAFEPPPDNGGTLAGDFVLNTDQYWQINGSAYDLQTVAIHEFGHALGMDHSAISSAVMYAAYTAKKQALTADDIAGIASIYGAPQPDAFDAAAPNNAYATASTITPYLDGSGQLALQGLDLTSASDADWYYVVAPATTTGTMTVRVQTEGISSMSPAVYVYRINPGIQLKGMSSMTASYGSTASVTFGGVSSGEGYYIRVVGADPVPTGLGAYGLLVNFGSDPLDPIEPTVTVVPSQPDAPGGGGSISMSDGEHEAIEIGGLTGDGHSLYARDFIPVRGTAAAAWPRSRGMAARINRPGGWNLNPVPDADVDSLRPLIGLVNRVRARNHLFALAGLGRVLRDWRIARLG